MRNFFVYTKNIPGPPQIINYPDRGPELGGPILRKLTLSRAGQTRRLGLWRNSGPEMGPEAPKKYLKCIHFIAQPDVFGQNRSAKGSKMAPTFIKPNVKPPFEPGWEYFFCMKDPFVYTKKGSHIRIPFTDGDAFRKNAP